MRSQGALINKERLKRLAARLETGGLWLMMNFRPLALFNRLVCRDTYRKEADLEYGRLARQRLDIYTPKGECSNLPVVLFFYGGSWQSGRRQNYGFMAQALTSRGCVVVIPDYRLYPEAKFPEFVEDGAAAFAWVHEQISRFGGDTRNIFLMGHSAGAYIAAMLSLNSHYLNKFGLSPDDVRGFIGMAGPYDFLPLKRQWLIKLFGGADGIPETQPINFVTGSAPPSLLLHGATDKVVRASNTQNLAQRLREAGRPVTEIIYPNYKHLTLLLYLASFLQEGEPIIGDVIKFIHQESSSFTETSLVGSQASPSCQQDHCQS
jgi:acetyl esterase/lipase